MEFLKTKSTIVTTCTICIIVIIFCLQNITGIYANNITDFLMYSTSKVYQGEIWRIFTCAFLHADFYHIFFNLTTIAVASILIEIKIGSRKYLFTLLSSIIMIGLLKFCLDVYNNSIINGLGFSGVSCFILSFSFMVYSDVIYKKLNIMNLAKIFIAYILCPIFIQIYMMIYRGGNIGYQTHLIGLMLGLLFGLKYLKKALIK